MTMYRRMSLAIVMLIALTTSIAAQGTPEPKDPQKARPRTATSGQEKKDQKTGERLEPDDASRTPGDVDPDVQANRQEQLSEEEAFKPHYNNFFSTYRLGPEDVISVEVFNHD